jgi:hypothetical protein
LHRSKLFGSFNVILAEQPKKEENIMQQKRTHAGKISAPKPHWIIVAAGAFVILGLITAFVYLPPGNRQISGSQLSTSDLQKATSILNADQRIQDLIAQGAVIDKILPMEITSQTVDTTLTETGAQAWLVRGSRDWGVQIDLNKSKIISIDPSSGN